MNRPTLDIRAYRTTKSALSLAVLVWLFSGSSIPQSRAGAAVIQVPVVQLLLSEQPASGDEESPSVPTSLTASAITANSITLNWSASTDNVGVTGYIVYANGTQVDTTSGSTSVILSSLTPSTSYSFTVAARDAAGNSSSQSAAVSATTSAAGPGGGIDEARFFVFGHSLFNHELENTGYWLGLLADASDTVSAGNGQFGQLSYHAVPPEPDAVFEYPTNTGGSNPWEDSVGSNYGDKDYSHTLFMPSNFEQEGVPPQDYLSDTYRVLDFVEQQEPSSEIVLYMHWPEPSMLGLTVQNGNQLGRADFTTFNEYTASGNYYDWHVDYQDLISAQRPAYNIRTIPVGPIIADIIENESYMDGVSFANLYEDDAPHGSPTIYFLAAMICYRAMYLQNPNVSYNPPTPLVIPEVANNYASLVSYIETRLEYYDSLPNGLNVY